MSDRAAYEVRVFAGSSSDVSAATADVARQVEDYINALAEAGMSSPAIKMGTPQVFCSAGAYVVTLGLSAKVYATKPIDGAPELRPVETAKDRGDRRWQ